MSSSSPSLLPPYTRKVVRAKKKKRKPTTTQNRLQSLASCRNAWTSSPNIVRKEKETVKPKIRRCQSENFLHSWDYSPIPFSQQTMKVKRRKSSRKDKRKRKKLRSVNLTASRKNSLGSITRSPNRRRNILADSHENPSSNRGLSSSKSSEPEELEIPDMDDDDESSTFSGSDIFDQPTIDMSPRKREGRGRSHSFGELVRVVSASDQPISFEEHRDQFERLWQASQLGESSYQDWCSVELDNKTEKIISGTLPHLINKLTDQNVDEYVSEFLETHLYFITVEKLMDCIFERYLMESPVTKDLRNSQNLEVSIRLRIINILKKWIEHYFCVFDSSTLEKLCKYIEGLVIPRQAQWGKLLREVIRSKLIEVDQFKVTINDKFVPIDFLADYVLRLSTKLLPRFQGKKTLFEKDDLILVLQNIPGVTEKEATRDLDVLLKARYFKTLGQNLIYSWDHSNQPEALLSNSIKYNIPSDILDVHPKEIARQLCLIEFDLFRGIEPSRDLINTSRDEKAISVNDCISYSNRLSRWSAGEVVQTGNVKKRIAVLRRLIEIANECRILNNFSSAAAIIFGLDHQSVQRLKNTWKSLPKKTVKVYEELTELISVKNNFEKLREAKNTATPPLIPYLATYLRDISLLELGNPTIIDGTDDVLNFSKFSMIASQFREIKKLQKYYYNFRRCSMVYRWLVAISGPSDDELFVFSDLCEERMKTTDASKLEQTGSLLKRNLNRAKF